MNYTKTPSEFQQSKWFLVATILLLAGLTFIGQIGFLISILLMIVLIRYQKKSWVDIGLGKPKSWSKTLGLSIAFVVIILAVFLFAINPLIEEFLPIGEKNIDRFVALKGNVPLFIVGILSSIITAGFAEEIIWRGYILKNLAYLFGDKKSSWGLALILSSVAFGLLHFYQGPMGIIQTGITGFFFGLIFIYRGKKNLWVNIITHSVIDILSLTAIYLGLI